MIEMLKWHCIPDTFPNSKQPGRVLINASRETVEDELADASGHRTVSGMQIQTDYSKRRRVSTRQLAGNPRRVEERLLSMDHEDGTQRSQCLVPGICDCMLPTNPPMKMVDGELLNTRPDLSLCRRRLPFFSSSQSLLRAFLILFLFLPQLLRFVHSSLFLISSVLDPLFQYPLRSDSTDFCSLLFPTTVLSLRRIRMQLETTLEGKYRSN